MRKTDLTYFVMFYPANKVMLEVSLFLMLPKRILHTPTWSTHLSCDMNVVVIWRPVSYLKHSIIRYW